MSRLKEFLTNIFYKFEHLYQKISLVSILLFTDIILIMGDFTFLFVLPEIAPMIFTIIIFMYFWKKYKEHNKFKLIIRFINSLVFYNFTFVWVYPYPEKSPMDLIEKS